MKMVTADASASRTARAPFVSSSSTTLLPVAWIRSTSERSVP